MTQTTTTAPQLDLSDLTLPVGSTQSVRRVLQAWLAKLLHDFSTIPLATLSLANRPLVTRTVQALARGDRKRALQLLRLPTISTPIQCALKQLRPGGDGPALNRWLRESCALIWLELAAQGAIVGQVVVPADGRLPTLLSPTLNLRVAPQPQTEQWLFEAGRLGVRTAASLHWLDLTVLGREDDVIQLPGTTTDRPYHAIVPGVWLAAADNNPLADYEAHPDKSGNAISLGERPASEWVAALQQSFALLDEHLPLLGEEVRWILRLVVPVGWHGEKHLSASYQEAVGVIYMTLHPQPMTMVEALIHEYQHNKINAVFSLDPLLHNAWSPLYASPVRPDPRPLHGVVLAVHAFQAVADLYGAMVAAGHAWATQQGWNDRYKKIIELDHQGALTVLEHAQPTAVGRNYLGEMRRLDAKLQAIRHERWPDRPETSGNLDELAGHD
jgi:HEXXH motif-containing protein